MLSASGHSAHWSLDALSTEHFGLRSHPPCRHCAFFVRAQCATPRMPSHVRTGAKSRVGCAQGGILLGLKVGCGVVLGPLHWHSVTWS